MILGVPLDLFVLFHLLLSLIGIGAGFVVVYGLLQARIVPGWTALFLATTKFSVGAGARSG